MGHWGQLFRRLAGKRNLTVLPGAKMSFPRRWESRPSLIALSHWLERGARRWSPACAGMTDGNDGMGEGGNDKKRLPDPRFGGEAGIYAPPGLRFLMKL